jgi:aspartokinase
VVKNNIEQHPMLYEVISYNLINYANLAEYLKPLIEKELGYVVKESAIVMALRRYSESIRKKDKITVPFTFNTELIMKTGIIDITIIKTPTFTNKLKKIFDLVNYSKGEILNIIHGDYEITIVINQKHEEKIKTIFSKDEIINIEKELVSLSMSFSKEFLYTPGILYKATRKLLWENVNIYENISTMTELIFIVKKKDAIRAYKALQELIENK